MDAISPTVSLMTTHFQTRGLRPVSLSDAWDLANAIGGEYMETSSRNNVRYVGVDMRAVEKNFSGGYSRT